MPNLVVDASVARAAGGSDCVASCSKLCRDFLQAMFDFRHRLTWAAGIEAEWEKHQSRFARKWRLQMVRHDRVDLIDVRIKLGLRKNILAAMTTLTERAAATKDFLLVEAAIENGQRIASRDEIARTLFARACDNADGLRKLVWVNPEEERESPVAWLRTGARAKPERTLARLKIDTK